MWRMTMAQSGMPGEFLLSLNSFKKGLAAMARVRMRATTAFMAPVRSLPDGMLARVASYSAPRASIFWRIDSVRLSRAGWLGTDEIRGSTRAAGEALAFWSVRVLGGTGLTAGLLAP